jgi:hypothetical protein
MITASRLRRRGLHAFAAGSAGLLIAAVLPYSGAQAVVSNFLELDGNEVSNGSIDWANSGDLTVDATTHVYSRSGTNGLFDGGIFNGNTTPPTAPTRTSAGTDIAAASFKVDPLSSDVTTCGTGDPTAYTGQGSEVNGGRLTSDTFSTSSIPNKDDLSNVFAVAHVSDTANEVFFGGERVVSNGDSHIDYEFLQSEVTIPNACSGSFSGHRTQGDFLLSVDFTSGGTLGGNHLYKWICDKTENAAHDGDVCDPPANGKSVPHYVETGNSDVTLTVNAGTTPIGCGGWVCRNADGSPTTTLAQNELMEGGIDLNAIGFTGCISTFLPHTRSSQSFTATLKDFEVIPFNTCHHPTVATQIKNASNQNVGGSTTVPIGSVLHDTATLSGASSTASGTVSYQLYSNNDCTGLIQDLTPTVNTVTNGALPDSATYTFTSAGTYYFQATYSGDENNIGPVSSACDAEPVTVRATPTYTSTPQLQVRDTFTVNGLTSDAGGTVTVAVYDTAGCTGTLLNSQSFTVAAADISSGSYTKTSTYIAATAGSYYFKITYSGDTKNTGFNGCDESATVSITSHS